jgi:hypothetical protein
MKLRLDHKMTQSEEINGLVFKGGPLSPPLLIYKPTEKKIHVGYRNIQGMQVTRNKEIKRVVLQMIR